jgi:hypothetical protein
MSTLRAALALILLALIAAPGHALQVQNLTLISPITNQPFETVGVPIDQVMGDALADMGYDEDGCRHTSGLSEYSYYVATDPYSYFSALTAEWEQASGRFQGSMPPDMKQWVEKEFNSEWQVDFNHAFQLANSAALAQGQPAPERKDYVMPQQTIPLEKRYRYAMMCYQHRGARPSVLAKTALMGAWALRTFINVPIGHQSLDGGYEEVNDKVKRHIKEGETFQLAKWLPIYKEIFDGADDMTNEGAMVAGLAYFGLQVRDGDIAASKAILESLQKRFEKMPEGTKTRALLQGIVRERKRMLDEYVGFETYATDNFIQAIKDEEFTRDDLVNNKLLVVAEGLRRTGREQLAVDWYLALSQVIETQPKLRDEIRSQGKAPSADATQPVQVGWMADQHLAALTKAGVVHSGQIGGPERALLNAIVFDGFGKGDYVNPNWKPTQNGDAQDCMVMLDRIGKAILDFDFRLGAWPASLNELWERGVMRDRNIVNRFHDPVKGKAFLYLAPEVAMEKLGTRTVLVSTADPIPSNQGDVFFAFLAGGKVEWSTHPLKPGEQFSK